MTEEPIELQIRDITDIYGDFGPEWSTGLEKGLNLRMSWSSLLEEIGWSTGNGYRMIYSFRIKEIPW